MPRALILCVATALLSGAVPVLAEDAKPAPPPAAPAASAPAPAAAAAPAPAVSAADEDAARRRTEAATDRRAMFEARLAALHAGLLLTPEQEKMWPAVETAIRDFAAMRTEQTDRHADRRQDADDEDDLAGDDPIAALKDYSDGLLRRAETLKAVADSAGPLWATMTEEQKHRVPRLLRELNPRRPHPGPHHADGEDGERGQRGPGWLREEPRDRDPAEGYGRRGRMSDDDREGDERGWRHGPRRHADDETFDDRW